MTHEEEQIIKRVDSMFRRINSTSDKQRRYRYACALEGIDQLEKLKALLEERDA